MIAQITNSPDIHQAVTTLIKAFWPHMTDEQIASLGMSIFLLARVLRKVIPDEVQNGKLGTLLKHLALEINPQTIQSTIQVVKDAEQVAQNIKPTNPEPYPKQ